MIKNDLFETNLEARLIDREGDTDYFIETFLYPLNVELDIPYVSRLQFPLTKAMIIRTTPVSKRVTIHMLSDTDLFSSCANFELDLEERKLFFMKEEGYLRLYLKDRNIIS